MCRLLLVSLFASAVLAAVSQKADVPTPKVEFLGRVADKSLFAQAATGNWTNSRNYCESLSMQILSIDTIEERDFLNRSYQAGVFTGYYHTGARLFPRYVWENSGEDISIPLPIQDDTSPTCLDLYIAGSGLTMFPRACSLTAGVVCQNS